MTQAQSENLSRAVKEAFERKRLGIEKPERERMRPSKTSVMVRGQMMTRPLPSDPDYTVLTVEEWQAERRGISAND